MRTATALAALCAARWPGAIAVQQSPEQGPSVLTSQDAGPSKITHSPDGGLSRIMHSPDGGLSRIMHSTNAGPSNLVTKRKNEHFSVNQCGGLFTPKMCPKNINPHMNSAIVVSSFKEDLHWLNEFQWPGNITVYLHERSKTRSHGSKDQWGDDVEIAERSEIEIRQTNSRRTWPVQFVSIPNKGDEAAAYLAYITTMYHSLPDVVYFIQGHRCAVHATFDMAKALPIIDECFPRTKGYLDMNRYHMTRPPKEPHCKKTAEIVKYPIRGFKIENFDVMWYALFAQQFGEMPERICWDSYAQFGVSKEVIWRHPVEFYEKLHKAVVKGATTMEFFWKMLFVKDAIRPKNHTEDNVQALFTWVMNEA